MKRITYIAQLIFTTAFLYGLLYVVSGV